MATSGQALPAVSNTFNVGQAAASISLENLAQLYDGTSKSVTAVTTPPGLTYSVTYTYNGNVIVPVNAGSYEVVATITDGNYAGSATGTLVISASLQVTVPGTAGGTVNTNIEGGPAAALGTPPVDSGIFLNAGSAVTITAAGAVSWYDAGTAPPNGALPWQPNFLAPSPTPGISLIARIGAGPWQFVGSGPTTLIASVDGVLQFAVNDSYYGDNGGAWVATISLVAAGVNGNAGGTEDYSGASGTPPVVVPSVLAGNGMF